MSKLKRMTVENMDSDAGCRAFRAPQYTVNDLRRDLPDLYERTKLPKGHPQSLTLPKAKREAVYIPMPSGIRFWKFNADGKLIPATEADHHCMTIGGPLQQLVEHIQAGGRMPVPTANRTANTRANEGRIETPANPGDVARSFIPERQPKGQIEGRSK